MFIGYKEPFALLGLKVKVFLKTVHNVDLYISVYFTRLKM